MPATDYNRMHNTKLKHMVVYVLIYINTEGKLDVVNATASRSKNKAVFLGRPCPLCISGF